MERSDTGGRVKIAAVGDDHFGEIGWVDPRYEPDADHVFVLLPDEPTALAYGRHELTPVDSAGNEDLAPDPYGGVLGLAGASAAEEPLRRGDLAVVVDGSSSDAGRMGRVVALPTDYVVGLKLTGAWLTSYFRRNQVEIASGKSGVEPVESQRSSSPTAGLHKQSTYPERRLPRRSSWRPKSSVRPQLAAKFPAQLCPGAWIALAAIAIVAVTIGFVGAVSATSRDEYSYGKGKAFSSAAVSLYQQGGAPNHRDACRQELKVYNRFGAIGTGREDPPKVDEDDFMQGCLDGIGSS